MSPRLCGIAGALIVVSLLLSGCVVQSNADAPGAVLSSFRVTVHEANSASNPVTLPSNFLDFVHTVHVDIEAVDERGQTFDLDGPVRVSAAPAQVASGGDGDDQDPNPSMSVTLQNGRANDVAVGLSRPYSRTSVWVEDSLRDGRTGVFGASPPVFFENPDLVRLQETNDPMKSALSCEAARGERCHYVTVDRGAMIVTSVLGDGFTITDTTQPCRDGQPSDRCFNHLYVFTHSFPHGIKRGQCLCWVSGIIVEYTGFTEMSFPAWDTEGACDACQGVTTPMELTPVTIDGDDLSDDQRMESLEAGLVTIKDAEVQATGPGYAQYGQWTVKLPDGAEMLVMSESTLPEFDPRRERGTVISSFTGVVRQIAPATPEWTLMPRDPGDLVR